MKRQTLKTTIREYLAPYPDNQLFRVMAHGLWRDSEGGWTSNDRFQIIRGDKAEVIDAIQGRWDIFKLNYSPRARVADLSDIGYDPAYGVSLECDYLPFVDIEPIDYAQVPSPRPLSPDSYTAHFLEALLRAYPKDDDDGKNPMADKSIFDFSPEFASAVEGFINGFCDYLAEREIDIPDGPPSFGGNVYFSLSGHGCGFRDELETEHLQTHLEAYAGGKYRFEEIDLYENPDTGKLDLAYLPEFIAERRAEMFTVKPQP